jgi:hypothetical protein
MSDNIQPDGSWRDPTAQMAMDIGLGKVNPSSAGYAAVEQAHQTYGSAHINGLWGHHGNAPTPPGSGWHFDSSRSAVNRPFPQSSQGFDAGYQQAAGDDGSPVAEQDALFDWEQVRDDCLSFAWAAFCCLVLAFFWW